MSKSTRLTPEQRLARARRFYERERYSAAGREAQRLVEELDGSAEFELGNAARLLGLFAYARAGEYERGGQLVDGLDPAREASLDCCYAACYLAYQRGDYDATEAWGSRYLELHPRVDPAQPEHNTHGDRHEILNTMGCAAKDRGDDTRALEWFDRAIAAKPDYPLGYLNAALVCRRSDQATRAGAYIDRGLERCGATEELRMLRDGVLRDGTISLCMIVRDEEEMLDDALASVAGIVDEIVVVDTGSVDRTVEIAERYGARVYRHAWEDDFANARNQSLSYARGDWILILDADERLHTESAPLVRKLANSCLQDGISFSVYNIDLDGGHVSFLPSLRMFRNGRGYRYRGIVHNQLDLPLDTPVLRAPIRIDHFGYTPSLADRRGKYERTTGLLRKQLEADPDDAFAHFNMAQIMRGGEAGASRAPQIIEHARRVTELLSPQQSDHLHILLMGYHQLATAFFNLGQYAEAERACRDALTIKPDYLDALMTLGHTLMQLLRHDEAQEAYLTYLRVRERFDESDESRGFILLNLNTGHEAHYGLGLIEEHRGNWSLALERYREALDGREHYREAHLRIGRISCTLQRWDEAGEAFEAELKRNPNCFWSHYGLGDVAAHRQDWPSAYEHFRAAYVRDPHHTSLAYNLALAAYHTGKLEEAGRHLADLPEQPESPPPVRCLAARLAAAVNDCEGAIRHFEGYLKVIPDDADAWTDLGNVYYNEREWQKSIACYDRALEARPALGVARRNRALVFLKRGQQDSAARDLSAYLEHHSGDPDARLLLADLYAGRGRHADALGLYERYVTERPDDLEAQFRLSQSYHAMGRRDVAALGYRRLLDRAPNFQPARDALSTLRIPG